MKAASIPAWLDHATAALLEETVSMLIKRHANILLAVILFGSVARHEERPLDDSCPSDVDVLAIFDTTDRLVKPYREAIFATIIDACALHLDAPREVNVLLSERTMQTWDSMFLTGKVSMFFTGSWWLAHCREAKNIDWDIAPLPRGKLNVR